MVQKKQTLVIATDNFLPRRDGITRFLSELIPYLRELYKIIVIAPDYDDLNVSIEGVDFVRIPFSKQFVGDFHLPRLSPRKIFKGLRKADLVFVQTLGPIGSLSLFLAQRLHKKTISFIHNVEWELVPKAIGANILRKYAYPITKRIVRFLYSRCTKLIVPSERIADLLTWEKIKTAKKIIHLGVNTTTFKPLGNKHDRQMQRKLLGIEEGDVVIGYHGRISREKDIVTLLRAFVKLRNRHKNYRLLIIGDGLTKLVHQLKEQEGVIYRPAVDNVESYLPLIDIYCLPSLTETTSLSTLEAMSCELPVISTPVGFIKDYITPKKTGLFFKAGDSYALSQLIEKLVVDKELQISMGKNARKMVQEYFSWEQRAQQFLLFFQNELTGLSMKQKDGVKINK